MIVFEHVGTKKLIGTSYKVCYTQFASRPESFGLVKSSRCDIFLTRNPVMRCISMWKDKCRVNLDPENVQWCQLEIMRELCIGEVEGLAKVSFEQFIDVLPKVILREGHFWPQLYGISLSDVGEIFRIEDGLPDLGIDMSERLNSTEHVPNPTIAWSTIQQIHGLYLIDFQLLGYKPICPRHTSRTSS